MAVEERAINALRTDEGTRRDDVVGNKEEQTQEHNSSHQWARDDCELWVCNTNRPEQEWRTGTRRRKWSWGDEGPRNS